MTDAEIAVLPRIELVLDGGVVLALEPRDYLHEEVRACFGVALCVVGSVG